MDPASSTGEDFAIEAEGLVKRCKKADRNAVDGISFAVRHGESFALLGPNGPNGPNGPVIVRMTLLGMLA